MITSGRQRCGKDQDLSFMIRKNGGNILGKTSIGVVVNNNKQVRSPSFHPAGFWKRRINNAKGISGTHYRSVRVVHFFFAIVTG